VLFENCQTAGELPGIAAEPEFRMRRMLAGLAEGRQRGLRTFCLDEPGNGPADVLHLLEMHADCDDPSLSIDASIGIAPYRPSSWNPDASYTLLIIRPSWLAAGSAQPARGDAGEVPRLFRIARELHEYVGFFLLLDLVTGPP
jgi:hypothetical protein